MEANPEVVPSRWPTVRILIMTDLYPPHVMGGAEFSCQSHAEGLQGRGHEVFILTSKWQIEQGKVEGNVYRLLHFDPTYLVLQRSRAKRASRDDKGGESTN